MRFVTDIYINSIKLYKELIELFPEQKIFIHNENFPIKYQTYHLKDKNNLIELADYLVNYKVKICEVHNVVGFLCIDVNSISENLAISTIKYYLQKYFQTFKSKKYQYLKKRLDPLKRELMAYTWHPSRINFEDLY